MSQPPKNKVPARRASTEVPEDRPATRSGSVRPQSSGGGRSNAPRQYSNSGGGTRGGGQRPRSVQYERRDPFPYVMGGVIGALVVGLMLMIFLITSNNSNSPNTAQNPLPPAAGVTTLPNTNNPTVAVGGAVEPIRMSMENFIALYGNPATRPIVVDVRAKAAFDEGHIAGAINITDAEAMSRLSELPKDKLVVAYCQ